MNTTSPQTRKLLAGVAAVVLTLGAAGAAVAVNLGTGAAVETPAGQLSATEPISAPQTSAQVTPSTIYVDLTVPVPTDSAGTAAPADQAPPAAATDNGTAVPRDDSWDDDEYEAEEHEDEDHEDEDHEDEEHEDGAEDDD